MEESSWREALPQVRKYAIEIMFAVIYVAISTLMENHILMPKR
jgi:hypothetical protein